ncbi:MAG: cation diffusion facilitator family transporter [Methanomassiliicoccales archaeon]|nr:cation diffusion facilitator family transporter [Methanomassiliicoccales archaeon]
MRKTKVAMLSIYSNSALVALKLLVGIMMMSVSVLSEAIHSMIDLLAAVIANYSVRKSAIPPDEDHEYGHGKYENYAGVIEAILIFFAALLIILEALQRLLSGAPVEMLWAGIVVMGISVVVNILVSHQLLKVGKQEDSMALIADGMHLRTDVYTSLGVFLGLIVIAITGIEALDPLIAMGVAVLIIKAAYNLTKESSKGLVDMSLPPDEEEVVRNAIMTHAPKFVNFHELRTRKSGSERFVDLHLVVNREMCVLDAHALCEDLEKEIERRLPHTHVLIHLEPCDETNCPYGDGTRFVKLEQKQAP